MSSAKKIAKNTGFLFSKDIIDKVMSFILVIIITRYLGSAGFGKYSFAFAFIGLFIMFSHFGLTTYMFREIAKDKTRAKKLADNIFTLKLFLLISVYIILAIIAWNFPKTKEIMLLIFLVMVHEFFAVLNTLMGTIFKAYERNEFGIYSTIIDKSLALLLGSYALISGYGIHTLVIALILAKLSSFVFRFWIIYKKFIKISIEIDVKFWKILIKNSIPFWLTMVFQRIYYRIDTVMLTSMKGYVVTGWYNAASTLIGALTFIPTVIMSASFPALSRFYHINAKDLSKLLYKKTFYYLLSIGIPISIGISLLSQRIILLIYKENFIGSSIALQILSWSLFLVFINQVMGFFLNSINKQHLFTLSAGICALSNIILNFILIPKLSYIGAATATVITQFINFCLLYYFTRKHGYPLNLIKISYKPIIAGILMGVLIPYIKFLHAIYIIPIAAVAYFIALISIGGIGKEEIKLIKSFLPKS